MPVLDETLTVLGCGSGAAALVLREALRFKTRSGSLIVHDAAGRGAMLLSAANQMGIDRRRVIWVDLADRRRPVSLFQIRRSGHLRAIWARVLRSFRAVAKTTIGDGTLEWAAEAAYSLSADGSVGLGALLRCLSSAETRRWFLETRNQPADLGKLLDMLAWALSFPAVYAVSEGSNRGSLLDAVEKPSVIWLESPMEHFEAKEHLLLQVLVEAVLEDGFRAMASDSARWADTMKELTILHLYPAPAAALPLEAWAQTHHGAIRHAGVHHLDIERPLPPHALEWVQHSEVLWVVGPSGPLSQKTHGKWLSPVEAARVSALAKGDLWIRTNRSGKSLVVRVRDLSATPGVADSLRASASKRRRPASPDQVAATVRSLSTPAGAHRDLYAALCAVEALRTGWFRVRESRSRCGGADGVTIASFGANAESELAALASELTAGRYRARPLRRIQIPKPDGGVRNLGIACIRDRVVQSASLTLLEPIFEPTFSRYSYGFRHGRNAHQAVAVVRSMIATGRQWAVISDVRKCFDNIDHEILLGLLAKRIADEEFLALIRGWLTSDVQEFRDLLPTEIGVPQGESISPLLANIYLDPLDKHFEQLGVAFARYADDLVVLTESEESAQEACRQLGDFLRDTLHLELKPAKTSYVPVSEGFDFLGFRITDTAVTVRQEKVAALLEYLTELIKDFGVSITDINEAAEDLYRINSIIRGWRNYFLLSREPALYAQMQELDRQVEQIASMHLPDSARANPAWLCRERLSLSDPGDNPAPNDGIRTVAPPPGPGYPEAGAAAVLPCLNRRSQGTPAPTKADARIGSPGPEDSEEDEETGSPPIGTTLEDGERLYVLTHGTYVAADKEDLILKKKRVEVYRRQMDKISMIYLQGFGISVSVDAQVRLAEHDVLVVFAPPLGNPVAVVNPIETTRSSIRRLQAIRRDEPDVVKAGIAMIAAKISNQAAVLKYFAKYRKRTSPETAAAMAESAEKMRGLADEASDLNPGEASVRSSVMGFEGHAAAIYWGQVAKLIPDRLAFGGRITQSAQDPVNQCLNYVYGILYGEVWRAVVSAGLDPYFGLIHGSVRDQGSLVFDLIEEFRAPFADRVVVGLMGRGFRPEIGRQGFLRTTSKLRLVRSFTSRWAKTMTYRSHQVAPVGLLSMQARSLVAVFQHEGNYHPYRMPW
jgi:RNA-directed DNA polymerase